MLNFDLQKILLPIDGSENNKIAIAQAIALAKELDADVTAFSVIDRSYLSSLYESIPLPEFSPEWTN
jgi:nucleotide-binding universal stress UspA family protein